MKYTTKQVLLWSVVGAQLYLLVAMTDPDTGTTNVVKHFALSLTVVIAVLAFIVGLAYRALQKLANGDLTAMDNHLVKYVAGIQDRRSPYLIEALSESLDSVLIVTYPWLALAASLEGYAHARFNVAEDGILDDIEIVEASHPVFAKALQQSLQRARGATGASASGVRQIRINFAIAP